MIDIKPIDLKKLIVIPIVILILSVVSIFYLGVDRGIDFEGGTLAVIKLNTQIDTSAIESKFKDTLKTSDIKVLSAGEDKAFVEIARLEVSEEKINEILGEIGKAESTKRVGATISEKFWGQAIRALIIGYVLMALVVLIAFRTIVPSFAVMLCAFSDIVVALGGMALFNIPLSLASIAALLMLIGYSVDTDILLTTRIVKTKIGTFDERMGAAMKTGLTMTFTAIAAVGMLYIFSSTSSLAYYLGTTPSTELSQITSVLIIGLAGDIPNTWIQNTYILKMYLERIERKIPRKKKK
ncbi:MAG: protein translocase subunit SecF [Euryarchaeota archaeon]|nr:protein translocase subunit SecF [Euryarchaeota archaeon]